MVLSPRTARTLNTTHNITKTSYRKDNRAMRPMYVYMSPLKIVCKLKISRRLRKNRHITILSLFGGEIVFEVFQPMWSGYLNVTDGQTDGRYTVVSPRGKTIGRQNVADIIGIADTDECYWYMRVATVVRWCDYRHITVMMEQCTRVKWRSLIWFNSVTPP